MSSGLWAKVRPWVWGLVLLLGIGLGGCIQADLSIDIHGQAGGELAQHIHLTRPAGPLLQQLQRQAKTLGGTAQLKNNQTLDIKLPFNQAEELNQYLNQLLLPLASATSPLPPLPIQAKVAEQNLLLFTRGQFDYDVDLRAWGVNPLDLSPTPETAITPIKPGQSGEPVVISPMPQPPLTIELTTPWGASIRNLKPDTPLTVINPNVSQRGHHLIWALKPGYRNHLAATYLYPNGLAWGSLAIGGLVWLAWRWQSQRQDHAPSSPT